MERIELKYSDKTFDKVAFQERNVIKLENVIVTPKNWQRL